MNQQPKEMGFTVIEVIIFFVVMVVLAVFFILQKSDLQLSYDDQTRKTAINSMFYSLTEIYHPEHGYYPSNVNPDTFKAVAPELLSDTWDVAIGDSESEYRYEGLDCNGEGKCQKFKLTASLDKEAEYTKTSDDKN
ncbi:MAG: hypothetical protein LBC95_00430 [Candidatus Nomurabacteria bacterium]|jgi:Tfp pilus assembly protein PilE|nr:hypothetical protein [Candidatus Nomurabacteria bacterium]